MRWVYQEALERSVHLPMLLRNIRLPVLSVRFLTDVVDKDQLIRQSLECRDLVDDAKRFHLRPDLRHEMGERRYRQRDGGDEYLVVIGGFGSDQNPSDSVEMFNPRTMEWSELPDLPISYRYVAACSLDTCVYVIGGFDGRERLNTICLLDIAQREEGWRWLTSMHYKRGLSAACTHKGLIYVCGGFDGRSRLRSLEVYHPKIDEWRILENMNTAREGAGLVVVDETLYCLGGYDGFHLLNSMEAFDLVRGTWSMCKPMYMRRSGAGCALLGDTIYVCGGYGGAEGRGPLHLDTVEAYNTRLAQWTLVTSMNMPRCYVGACPLAGKIYVAAGYNGSRLLDTIESYDPIENVWWLHEDSRMNHERCDTGMCVVRFLSCAEPFNSPSTSSNSRVASSSVSGLHGNATPALPSSSGANGALHTTHVGPPGSSRPSGDATAISNYRIPMLPIPTHLREISSNVLRPNPETHAVFTGQMTDSRVLTTLTHTTASGLPSSALAVSPALSRDDASLNATTSSSSLRMHPHLPMRHHSNAMQASQLPAPGCLASRQRLPTSGVHSSQYPRPDRQTVSVTGIASSSTTPGASNSGNLRFDPPPRSSDSQDNHMQLSGNGCAPDAPHDQSSGASRFSQHTLLSPPNELTAPCIGIELDGDCVEVDSTSAAHRPGSFIRLASGSNVEVCENPTTSSTSAAYCGQLYSVRRLVSHSGSRPVLRWDHNSSPPCFSRVMYHSAPETGFSSSSSSSQPHPVNELFRSAEGLDFLITNDYRLWLEGAGSCRAGDILGPNCDRETADPPVIHEQPAISSSNSDILGVDPGFRTLDGLNLEDNEGNGGEEEDGDGLEDAHGAYANETFEANRVDSLFHCVYLDDPILADGDHVPFSDAPAFSSASSSSASDGEFENTEEQEISVPEPLIPRVNELDTNNRVLAKHRLVNDDNMVEISMVSSSSSLSSCPGANATSNQSRNHPLPRPYSTSSSCLSTSISGTQDAVSSSAVCQLRLGPRSAFRSVPVSGMGSVTGASETSGVRSRIKPNLNPLSSADSHCSPRFNTDDSRKVCGQGVNSSGDSECAISRLLHPLVEQPEDGSNIVPDESPPSASEAPDHVSSPAQYEAGLRVSNRSNVATITSTLSDSGPPIPNTVIEDPDSDCGHRPAPSNVSGCCLVQPDQPLNVATVPYVVQAADTTHVVDDPLSTVLSLSVTSAVVPDQSPCLPEPAPETRSDGEGEEEEDDGGEGELTSPLVRSLSLNEIDAPDRPGPADPGLRQQNQAVGQTDAHDS
ncbi:Kelch protein 12 [Fasciolopsis buskii]|uniref:Kelch protein 12 n=1 Tax=Fasciolopsis buskii TaxID=27845 RepID=A0A8E0RZQ3_9TREM|nr:Kelch protein 12 [Fasciolopsis buski]